MSQSFVACSKAFRSSTLLTQWSPNQFNLLHVTMTLQNDAVHRSQLVAAVEQAVEQAVWTEVAESERLFPRLETAAAPTYQMTQFIA